MIISKTAIPSAKPSRPQNANTKKKLKYSSPLPTTGWNSWQLQLIQNAAARILTRTRKSEHITPVLRSLHWLPVTFRIDFKVLLLVYKSLNGLGPKYMSDMLTEYKPNRPLRSLGSSQLEIPRVHTKQGESAFSYYAARSWNQLPEEIRCAKTIATFKSSLKTHLFSCAFVEWALCYVRTDCIVFYV